MPGKWIICKVRRVDDEVFVYPAERAAYQIQPLFGELSQSSVVALQEEGKPLPFRPPVKPGIPTMRERIEATERAKKGIRS